MHIKIKKAIDNIISIEGGYSNHPSDRGGPTKFGITQEVARLYGYTGNMVDMNISEAYKIYEDRYMRKPNFHLVMVIDEDIGFELFDTGVNMGPGTASIFLQRWLNGFNSINLYSDLLVDGRIGNITLNALSIFLKWRGGVLGKKALLRGLNSSQGERYLNITENNKSQRDFLFGWILNRLEMP